jgi:hypothetical protein
MSTVSHTPTENQIKQSAKAIKSALKELHNFEINYTQSLEISSRAYGFKDWNTACAMAKKHSVLSTLQIDEIVIDRHPDFYTLDDMSPANKSIFMQTVRDCAVSVRLSHLAGIENKAMVDKMLEDAVLLTYNSFVDHANLSHFIDSLKLVKTPSSMVSMKEDILYMLSNKTPELPINYYGIVLNAAKKPKQLETTTKEEAIMLSANDIQNIVNNAKAIPLATLGMHNYINTLTKEEYASLATVFIVGRSGWERNYAGTNEYYTFIESKETEGITVTQAMLDAKFLTTANKRNQVEVTYQYELSHIQNDDDIEYQHNWLSQKTNLIIESTKGISMLGEI